MVSAMAAASSDRERPVVKLEIIYCTQ